MSNSSKHKIFQSTDCIPEKTMFDYIDDKLSPKEQHTIERHMLDCELCSDALEGLELIKDRKHIGAVNQRINELAAKEKKIIGISYRTITAIAAGLLLLIGSVFFFDQFTSNELMNENVADLKETTSTTPIVIEETAKADSIASDFSVEPKSEYSLTSASKPTKENKEITESLTTNSPVAGAVLTADNDIIVPADEIAKKDELKKEEKDNTFKETETQALPEAVLAKKRNTVQSTETYNMASKSAAPKVSEPIYKEKDKEKVSLQDEPYSLNNTISNGDIEVYPLVDKKPEFPGGKEALLKYVQTTIQFPATDDKGKPYRSVQIQFIVSASGKANDPKLLKPQSKVLEKQVVEMVNKMPVWKPAQLNGNPVYVKYILPVMVD